MRFDPQANAVERDTDLQKMLTSPTMGSGHMPGDIGARSPLKTALILLALGFIGGGGYWIWAEGIPGFEPKAAAGATSGSEESYAVIQYAESLINGQMEASLTGGAPGGPDQGTPRDSRQQPQAQDEYERGQALMSMGQNSVAAQHFAEAVRLDPGFAEAHYRLGLAHVRAGDYKAARRTRAALARLDADLANLLGNLIDD